MNNVKVLFALLVCPTLFAQSPWTKKKKEAYVQVSFTSIANYNKLFGNPAYSTERNITDNTLQLYTEYGISDKTTIIASVPVKMVASEGLVDENSLISFTTEESKTALGNLQLGVKHNFYNKKWLISGQLNVETNTGTYSNQSGLRTGYDAWTFTPLISVGRGFNGWYVQSHTGVDIRTNNYSSNFKLGGEVGYKAIDWLWVAGFLDGVMSLKNGDRVESFTNTLTGLYVNDQSYAAYGLKLIGEISPKLGANVGIGGAFSGRNVAQQTALTFGVYYKM